MMLLDLGGLDGRPIYGQIADRVKFAVASGALRPGELIPSVRELSKQLVVNPNTVARAYRDLQAEGLLDPVRGTGLQVAEGAVERCRRARADYAPARIRAAFEEVRSTGLEPSEVDGMIREEWARIGGANGVAAAADGGGES